jgi:hypothetical protein
MHYAFRDISENELASSISPFPDQSGGEDRTLKLALSAFSKRANLLGTYRTSELPSEAILLLMSSL